MKFEEALYCQILRHDDHKGIGIIDETSINWHGIYYDGFQVDRIEKKPKPF
jgi:hypothetical protein